MFGFKAVVLRRESHNGRAVCELIKVAHLLQRQPYKWNGATFIKSMNDENEMYNPPQEEYLQ